MKKAAEETTSLGGQLAELARQSRRRVAIVLAIVLAAFLGYHVMFGANGITAYRQKRSESRELQKQIQQLQQENGRLTEHIQHLKTDPDTIEQEARTILHYARPGEVIYKFNDTSSTDQTPKR